MYKFLLLRLIIGIIAGALAWFIGNTFLRGHIVF
jgi:hypothetical protein